MNYTESRCHAFVCDITATPLVEHVPANIVDHCFLIFVLSAISPSKLRACVESISATMKSGGMIYFRDYASDDVKQHQLNGMHCATAPLRAMRHADVE